MFGDSLRQTETKTDRVGSPAQSVREQQEENRAVRAQQPPCEETDPPHLPPSLSFCLGISKLSIRRKACP